MRDSPSKDLGFTPLSHLGTTVCLSNLRRDVFGILATPLHRLERWSGFADYVSLKATSQAHSPYLPNRTNIKPHETSAEEGDLNTLIRFAGFLAQQND